jgi:hypothetical protein
MIEDQVADDPAIAESVYGKEVVDAFSKKEDESVSSKEEEPQLRREYCIPYSQYSCSQSVYSDPSKDFASGDKCSEDESSDSSVDEGIYNDADLDDLMEVARKEVELLCQEEDAYFQEVHPSGCGQCRDRD